MRFFLKSAGIGEICGLKRLFDLAIAVPSVIILSPVLVLIGFMVRLKIGSPVLFRQVRQGLHGRPFIIYGDADRIYHEYAEHIELVVEGQRINRG